MKTFLRSASLRIQLIGGFLLLALVVLVVVLIGNRSTGKLGENISELGEQEMTALEDILRMQSRLLSLSRSMTVFLNPQSDAAERENAIKQIAADREVYRSLADEFYTLLDEGEEQRLYQDYQDAVGPWAEANNRIMDNNRQLLEMDVLNPTELLRKLEGFKGDHHAGVTRSMDHVESGEHFAGGEDPTACRYGQWILTYDGDNEVIRSVIRESRAEHDQFHESVGRIQELLAAGDIPGARKEAVERLLPLGKAVIGYFDAILEETAKAQATYEEMVQIKETEADPREEATMEVLNQLVEMRRESAEGTMKDSLAEAGSARTQMLIIGIVAVLGSLAFGVLFANRLSGRLGSIAERIGLASGETRSASQQVADSSTSLAEGASEQAASLEETSSSMEEVTNMVKRDAEMVETTSGKAQVTQQAVDEGVRSMKELREDVDAAGASAKELSEAMESIQESSNAVSKIIKTIDEIAFQTNILALNAAVEAARAGEAGSGFAVVADEVRSLAGRAAEAARETQGMIEESVERSRRGVEVNQHVNDRLGTVLEKAQAVDSGLETIASNFQEVDHSMGHLSKSFREQQDGIQQINTAVGQVNEVTQSNAANAEEAASASEELTAQAESLNAIVNELTALVRGSAEGERETGGSTGSAGVSGGNGGARRLKERAGKAALPMA